MASALKGQVGVEFFFVIAFILLLAISFTTTMESEVAQTKELNRATLAKTVSDAVSHAINIVALQGNGAATRMQEFIPSETLCLQYNATSQKLYCTVAGVGTVSGPELYAAPTVNASCFPSGEQGWLLISVNNTAGSVGVYCSSVG
ncbi:hypothetical protein H0O03_01895 [Candidatus Micrarchaeota archaeon]|nr:hypothetical protein [Candidatus Micrarchaeota archaeon]